jgi:5'-deoxynucleotidase YfbR-like HD superfamily hydrolase
VLAPISLPSTTGSHLYHVAFTGLLILAPKAAEKPRANLWESAMKLGDRLGE